MFVKLKIKSFEFTLIDNYIKSLLKTKKIIKMIRLPMKIRKMTILSSPHVNIKAREQYEIRTYSYLLIIKREDLILPASGISYRLSFLQNL